MRFSDNYHKIRVRVKGGFVIIPSPPRPAPITAAACSPVSIFRSSSTGHGQDGRPMHNRQPRCLRPRPQQQAVLRQRVAAVPGEGSVRPAPVALDCGVLHTAERGPLGQAAGQAYDKLQQRLQRVGRSDQPDPRRARFEANRGTG